MLLKENAIIAGPHQGGKVVLILTESIGSNYYWMTKCASWKDSQHKKLIAEIAVASQKGTKPLIVEYVSAAIDGEGRLYARQSCAPRRPRMLRAVLFGGTHKEVDISGAHYELIRLGSRSTLVPIGPLRQALLRSFRIDCPASQPNEMIQNDVKLFPILVINSGSAAACNVMSGKGYLIHSWIKLWADELVLARNCVSGILLPRLRPDLPTTYRNRHFHSAESLEAIFMRNVLLEVQRRSFAVSTIWLHDGFWICTSVRDNIIEDAEKASLANLFPHLKSEERILKIKCLTPEMEMAKRVMAEVKPSVLIPHCSTRRKRTPRFAREFPKPHFSNQQVPKRKADTYFKRISKRIRTR